MTDPIADYLTRVRNAIKAQHRVVEIPASNLKKEITKILFEKGYILNYKFVDEVPCGIIKIALKYNPVDKVNAIKKLTRISTPGLRQYVGYKEMPRVLNGLGIAILSTSKGVMTDKEAKDPQNRRRSFVLHLLIEEEQSMSRIGKLPIQIPSGVTVTMKDSVATVKGPKGTLSQYVNPDIEVKIEDGIMTVSRPTDERQHRSLHGLYRSLLNNMVVGVSEGYKKELELVGVGYRASNTGQLLELSLGYTHNIYMQLPDEVKLETKTERNKNPLIILESADKQLIGQVCSKIRSFRKPEPYKGKGVRFVGEVVRRKSGKSAGK